MFNQLSVSLLPALERLVTEYVCRRAPTSLRDSISFVNVRQFVIVSDAVQVVIFDLDENYQRAYVASDSMTGTLTSTPTQSDR